MKRNAKTILAVLLVAVTLLGLAAPALAETASYSTVIATGYVQAKEDVNIRKGPGTSYARIGWLEGGTVVIRTGTSGNWTPIPAPLPRSPAPQSRGKRRRRPRSRCAWR